MAIKLHFSQNSSYSAIKFNFKIAYLTYSAYEKRPDRFYYEKLYRRYPEDRDLVSFYLANILERNPGVWIGDMTDAPLSTLTSRLDSFSYKFKGDVRLLVRACSTRFDDLLRPNIESRPAPSMILKMLVVDRSIMLETVTVIDQLVNFLRHNKRFITSDSGLDPLGLWAQELYKIQQYGSFLVKRIDLAQAKTILIQEFTFSPDMV